MYNTLFFVYIIFDPYMALLLALFIIHRSNLLHSLLSEPAQS